MNIKTFTDAPRSDKAREFVIEVQDFFSESVIVGVKYIFTPVRGRFHMYIWNEYMNIGIYYQEFENNELSENFRAFTDKILQNKKINIEKCNYYQWVKLMHEDRPDWQEKYPEWYLKYQMYKVEKLFDK